jgi:hypothetical protein
VVFARTSVGRGDTVRVDAVWVVVLGAGLGRGKTGEGSNAEGECGTHIDVAVKVEA